MAATTKWKTASMKVASQPTSALTQGADDYDSWDDSLDDSWLDSDLSDIDLSDWSDDLEADSTPSRAKSVKKKEKAKPRKSIVQIARSGQLANLQALLNELDDNDVNNEINEHDGKNYSALHYAAQSDNVEMVRLLVNRGADVNDIGEASRRPLHFAAAARKEKDQTKSEVGKRLSKLPEGAKRRMSKAPSDSVTRILVNGGAEVNAQDNRGRTPLYIAASLGNSETASHLLESEAIDIECEDQRGITALLAACFYGKTDVALMLINKGAKLNVWDDNFDTPLHFALREGNKKVARRIIEKGKQEKCLSELLVETNQNVVAPIHEAVRYGHKDLVQLALEHVGTGQRDEIDNEEKDDDDSDSDDEDVLNYGGENDNTPLHEACIVGRLEMVKMLCEKGAKINVQNWDYLSPLHFACANNHQQVAEYLIEKGAIMSLADDEGLTPLQTAANSKSFDTIIALLDYQRNLDTSTNAKDNQDAAAELLKWAAEENKADTLQLLLHQGRKLHGMSDDDITKFIQGASKNGHTETVVALIRWKREVVDDCDDDGNTPLHHAAEAGHDITVQELIKAKARVNDENFESGNERTPLHYAAANGWIRTVNLLLKSKANINADDMLKMTPLHLACKNGHTDMVKLLVYSENADILLRDKHGLNCLDHAIDNGHEDIANLLISHDKWQEVMSVCSSDQETGERTTPMRKLIKTMPEIAERVMDRCVRRNPEVRPNDADYWVEFYYELLEDSFSKWERPKDSDDEEDEDDDDDDDEEEEEKDDEENKEDAKHQNDAFVVDPDDSIGSGELKQAETSFISEPNGKTTTNDTDDDVKKTTSVSDDKEESTTTDQYDSRGHLKVDATPYTTISKDIALSHPLNIMVSAQRTNLLSHPLVASLLNHKWSKVGRFFFWASLVFYFLFVAMLTGYVLVVPPSYYVRFANATDGVTWFTNGEERWVGEFSEATLFFFGRIGDWIILILAIINVIRELFQLFLQRRSYFGFGNLIEWSLYILAILLVLPLSRVQYYNGISIRLDWQWQCGAVAVFLAWINLILFIRRFSVLGIYVIMFIDIVRTFMKFVLVLILFVVAFALAFYTLLMNQQPFHRIEYSFAKTFVMMIGELDFGNIFHSQNYLNTENTLADGEEDFFLTSVFYQSITYVIFTLFLVIMSILIMNLLVGLAVDDIHAIQEKAKLHRLAMQVELVMEVQQALPIFIWRSAVIRRQRFYVNRARLAWLEKWYRALTGDKHVLRQASKICIKNQARGDVMHETVTTDQLFTNLKYRLKRIDSKVEAIGGTVNDEIAKQAGRDAEISHVRSEQKSLKDRFDRMEKKIDALLKHGGVKLDEES
ncbi:uncharacterized protein [Diadema setosum]|uniref:uncharacterized protein n=1 Tax=Diadema setosum TaxID=31175 RepID=UPI003B3A897D